MIQSNPPEGVSFPRSLRALLARQFRTSPGENIYFPPTISLADDLPLIVASANLRANVTRAVALRESAEKERNGIFFE